jgi:alkanesulfonate monooxygenase SsuD/methylene tetrahydromethanopterin reductase-like flavin-dependent oxidoreductase (luciferase family)
MKLGMFMMPVHPPDKDRTKTFEEDTAAIVLAEELGFTEAWIGQHHSAAWEPIPSNDLFIASLIPQTTSIRLGTGVSILPQHHPANVATRLAFLDHLSHGRLNVGFGQGGVPSDWGLFDLPDPKTQGLMTLEAIELIMLLWQADAPFDFKGEFYRSRIEERIPELRLGELLKPYQRPHPPIAMSIVKGESMAARMAGQRGYIPLSTNLVAGSTVKRHWELYCEGAKESGVGADPTDWRVSRSIHVGESDEEARNFCLQGAFADSLMYLRGMVNMAGLLDIMKTDPAMPDEAITREYLVDEIAITGSPDTVATKLNRLYETTGGFGTTLMIAHDWDDEPKMRRSLELMAKEVIPQLP